MHGGDSLNDNGDSNDGHANLQNSENLYTELICLDDDIFNNSEVDIENLPMTTLSREEAAADTAAGNHEVEEHSLEEVFNVELEFVDEASDNAGTSGLNDTLLQELREKARLKSETCISIFTENVMMKISRDLKNPVTRQTATKFLIDVLDDYIDDKCLLNWLAKGLGYKPHRLKHIIENVGTPYTPRNSLSSEVHQKIYDFWLRAENCIPTTDKRGGRDRVQMVKTKYLQEFKHLQKINDSNLEEKEKAMKRSVKVYISAQRMIYTKTVKKLYDEFVTENPSEKCSFSTFFRFKPFYVSWP